MTETCWLFRSDVYYCLFSASQPTWLAIQTTTCMAQSKNFSGAWQQRSTGVGQRCMLHIMRVTRALATILLLGLHVVTYHMMCICYTIHITVIILIIWYVDGTATNCQAPTGGTVDLLSGGEATVTPAPTPAPEAATKTVAEAVILCNERMRFMMVYGCLWQTLR